MDQGDSPWVRDTRPGSGNEDDLPVCGARGQLPMGLRRLRQGIGRHREPAESSAFLHLKFGP